MGKSITCNYEVQAVNPINQRRHCVGVMKYKEALKILLEESMILGSCTGYIWPQTGVARRKINNISWVTNHRGIDFLKVEISLNTPKRKKYTISGENVSGQDR